MKRRGFTLVELLCVMACLAVLGTALVLIMNHILLAERLQAQGYDRIQQSRALADQFRFDVARAEKPLDRWDEFDAGPTTLILAMKSGEHTVYQWRDGALKRLVTDNGETTERAMPLPIGAEVEFIAMDADSKLARLRLHIVRNGKIAPGQALEIAAALGGDWR
jgi:prepilin-type N-terminal cleavage/methylation domain-containing protein